MTRRNDQDKYDVIQAREEFDSTKQKKVLSTGLINKYYVSRADGRDKENVRYFVLDPANDPFAMKALITYADACRFSEPELSKDLLDWLEEID